MTEKRIKMVHMPPSTGSNNSQNSRMEVSKEVSGEQVLNTLAHGNKIKKVDSEFKSLKMAINMKGGGLTIKEMGKGLCGSWTKRRI